MDAPSPGPTVPGSRRSTPAGLAEQQRAAILARFYDLDVLDVSYDAELYLRLAHECGGQLLELAVGSGRLAIPLALAGHHVVGVDHDPAMLDRARTRWDAVRGSLDPGRLSLHQADFLDFRTEDRFGLAFIAVNTFLLAEDDEARLALLGTMRDHLRPGGAAVVEVSTPDQDELATFDGRLQLEWLRHDPESDDLVAKLVSVRHDPDTDSLLLNQLFEWTAHHGGPVSRVAKSDTLHLISAERLAELATRAGFAETLLWEDHLLTPYAAGSPRVIMSARLV